MEVINRTNPTPEQFQRFLGTNSDETMVMVNLLKFRERAEYPDGDRGLSGAEAYAIYGTAVQKCIADVGGRSLAAGEVTGLLLGEVEELWDIIALVEYPSSQAMLKMVMSPDYQAITIHRDAGLAGQLNIRIAPLQRS